MCFYDYRYCYHGLKHFLSLLKKKKNAKEIMNTERNAFKTRDSSKLD